MKVWRNLSGSMVSHKKIVVAMSGGVDSSVAAALLVDQGYEVIGMMLRLWSEPGNERSNRCCAPDAMVIARRVATQLNIPFYVVDSRQIFHEKVVRSFYHGYAQGVTPNPCLVCNRLIRWGYLLDHARSINADFFATGHYARLVKATGGNIQLLRATDENKDQSYVLHVLSQEQLKRTILPLGNYSKDEVRQIARDFDLSVGDRSESQDLCFLGNDDYRSFLQRNVPDIQKNGPIIDREGKILGEHKGLAFYTIGQRKGLGLSSPHPLYVLDKNINKNTLIVGSKGECGRNEVCVTNINWISGNPPDEPIVSQVKIRYRAPFVQASITPLGTQSAQVFFDQPLHEITPGQAAVFYDQDRCLGGGIIQPFENTTYPRISQNN